MIIISLPLSYGEGVRGRVAWGAEPEVYPERVKRPSVTPLQRAKRIN